MSQVRSELLPPPSRSDSPNGVPPAAAAAAPRPAPSLPTSSSPNTGQDENFHHSSVQNSAVAPTSPTSTSQILPSQRRNTDIKEENLSQEYSASTISLMNGTASSQAKSEGNFVEAVICQPQRRASIQTHPTSVCTPLLQNGAGHLPVAGGSNGEAGNGVLCSELSSLSSSQKPHRKLQSHHSINSQISKKSKGSSKSASSQIPTEAQEDCCVHCILSCLFCEFLTLCNIMLDCATCGSCSSEDSCICCCCCGSGECADCDLPCDMDCGILDACCESADCLEICMECCGLCFSS